MEIKVFEFNIHKEKHYNTLEGHFSLLTNYWFK